MMNIKINEEFSIRQEYKEYNVSEGGEYSASLMKEGFLYSSILVTKDEEEHNENVAELVMTVINEDYETREEVEQQVVIEGMTYNIWVALSIENNKIVYDLSTFHNELEQDENEDANSQTRKSWKGFSNYINRFLD